MEDKKKILNKALEYHRKGKFNDAISIYLKILPEQNKNSQLLFVLGTAYIQIKKYDLAIDYLKKSISINQNNLGAYNNLGGALQNLKRYEQAINIYNEAIKINPNFSDLYNNLGNCFLSLKKYENAIENYKKSLKINSENFVALNNLGNTFKEINNYEEAINYYKKAININPNYYMVYSNLGNALSDIKKYEEALNIYKNLIKLKPNYKYIAGKIIHTKMLICDWINFDNEINSLLNSLNNNNKTISPYQLLSLVDNPNYHKICSEIFAKDKFLKLKNEEKFKLKKSSKTKIGYFSPDFRDHAVLHLIMDVFKNHDKSKFEIYAFSFSPENDDKMTEEIKNYFTKFIDIRKTSNEEVAKICRKIGLDIAIDLCGYTAWNRAEIFLHRAAPIQINYLGYPGTMGSKFIDYILADKTLITDEDRINYSEKVIYLPNCYQANIKNNNISKKNFKRTDFGLPDKGFIFCNFNSNHKITPEIYDLWINILKKVPDSVLWLMKSNSIASKNLWKEAEKRNVEKNRIIFAEHLPKDEHLKRIKFADLFLDTFPYNAHTTASDAIRMGVPIITLKGKSFASRVSASILNQVNLMELITTNKDDFQNFAINLAKDKKKLKKIKDDLKISLSKSTLFDSVKFTKDIENLFLKLINEKN